MDLRMFGHARVQCVFGFVPCLVPVRSLGTLCISSYKIGLTRLYSLSTSTLGRTHIGRWHLHRERFAPDGLATTNVD